MMPWNSANSSWPQGRRPKLRLWLSIACVVALTACGSTPPSPKPTVDTEPPREILGREARPSIPAASSSTSAAGRIPLWQAARDLGLDVALTGRSGERRLSANGRSVVIAADRSTYEVDGATRSVPYPGILEIDKGLHLPTALVESLRSEFRGLGARREAAPRTTNATRSLAGLRIVIDPGHGGKDTGAGNRFGPNEKVLTLAIGNLVTSLLRQRGANVIPTRTGDTYPSLDERAALANRQRATVFLSIHVNSASNPEARGVEAFYPNSGSSLSQSKELARMVVNAVVASTGAPSRGAKQDPRGLRVLKATQMPAILLEVGFVTHRAEALLLKDPAYQRRIAEGIIRGLEDYAARSES